MESIYKEPGTEAARLIMLLMALYTYSSIRYPYVLNKREAVLQYVLHLHAPLFSRIRSFPFVPLVVFEQCLIQDVAGIPPRNASLGMPLSNFAMLPSPAYACFLMSLAACFRLKLHSSYARPAPKPTPTNAGHALRLNKRTEKTTPKPSPRVDLTRRLDRHRSHCTLTVSDQFISPTRCQTCRSLPSHSKVPR